MGEIPIPVDGPLDVVFFFSGGASSMQAVLESPGQGKQYRVVGAVTNATEKEAPNGYDVARNHGVPLAYVDTNVPTREAFYDMVECYLREMHPYVIGLSGWLRKYSLVPKEFIEGYRNRIFNVHPADLSVVAWSPNVNMTPAEKRDWYFTIGSQKRQGKDDERLSISRLRDRRVDKEPIMLESLHNRTFRRLITGGDAVALAVLLGETEVCSTVHSVNEVCDGGTIAVQSTREPVDTKYVNRMWDMGEVGRIVDYAHELQKKMKVSCDGPAFCKTLELAALDRLGVGDEFATLDREIMPYGGFQL